jgi:ribosome-binding factor A
MRQTARTRKLSEIVRESVASIVLDEISDPRLELVTVTGAEVASDMSIANIFVTAHGDQERYDEVLEGLESAKGRIRSLLGRSLHTRQTPELRFYIDKSVDSGMRIGEALKHRPATLDLEAEDLEDEDLAESDDPSRPDGEE